MIIYGTQPTTLRAEDLSLDKCPNCQSQQTLQLSVLARYFHLYFIPTFPFRKAVVSYCSSCRQILEERQMPDHLYEQAIRMKTDVRYPLWYFSGLGLIGLLIAGLTLS